MAQFFNGKNQFHQEQYQTFDFVVEYPDPADTPATDIATSAITRAYWTIAIFFVDSEGVYVIMQNNMEEYQLAYIAAMLTRGPLDKDLRARENKFGGTDEIYYDFTTVPDEEACRKYFRLKKLEPRRHE